MLKYTGYKNVKVRGAEMGIFDGILIISDLDGTLLRSDKSVSEENKLAIKHFINGGGMFTFITGRAPCGMLPVLEQITPNAPVGCLNGGGIYDIGKKEYLYKHILDLSAIEIVSAVDTYFPEAGIEIFGFNHIYFAKSSESTEKHRVDECLENISCDYRNPPEDVSKVLFGVKKERMALLEKTIYSHPFAENFDFIRSDSEYFELLPKGSCKGAVLDVLTDKLGIPLSKTVAVGDNDNDVSMLKIAGLGIAVANASTSAKEAADVITVSNEEHAIAKIIYDIENGVIRI